MNCILTSCIVVVFASINLLSPAVRGQNAESPEQTSQVKTEEKAANPQNWRIMLDCGFAHWTSDRFRTAILGEDLGYGLRFNPGIKWLQLHARYDYSYIRVPKGDTAFTSYDGRYIGFTTLGLAVCKEFRHKNQGLLVSYSAGVVLVDIAGRDISVGASGSFRFDYLFYLPEKTGLALGVSLSLLSRTYNITDKKVEFEEWYSADKENLDRDLNAVLGVVVSYNLARK